MPRIELVLDIAAPIDRCFDLARSVDAHIQSASSTEERAVAGVTTGLMRLGDEVTWEARHLGVRQRLTSRITAYERPVHFRDSQVKGAFARFDHDHYFETLPDGRTRMRDIFDYTAPFGLLGVLAGRLFLTSYMRRFLLRRNREIARLAISLLLLLATRVAAQTPDWCQHLPRPQYRQLHRVPSADPWFEVYTVAPNVYAIYEPHQAEEAISFLILGQRRAALFDTGLGIGDIQTVATGLTQLPIVVLNSHTHDDHVGDNWEFTEILGMDTQFTRTNALGSVADAQGELTEGSICGQLPPGFDPKAYATRPWRITRWMHDGDTVDLGGRVLRVLSTPGHTPDSICLLDEENGLLWTGDSYYPGTIWLKRPETDLDAYERSMTRIAALVPRLHLVLGSHNVPVAEPSILTKLLADIRAVRSGRVPAKPAEDGNVTYDAGDGIMFLMHPR